MDRGNAASPASPDSAQAAGPQSPKPAARWLLAALLAVAALTRLYNLDVAPYFFCDEAYLADTALHVARQGTLTRYFFDYPVLVYGKPPFHYLLVAGAFKCLGFGVWQGRLVSVVFGLGSAAVVFLIGRAVGGHRGGLVALLLYAFSRYALYVDRSVKAEAQTTFLALACIYLLWLASERRSSGLGLAAGLMLGLSLASKPTGWYLAPAGLGFLLVAVWRAEEGRRRMALLAVAFVVGCALVVGPWAAIHEHLARQPPYDSQPIPEELFGREITELRADLFLQRPTPYGLARSLVNTLGKQFLRSPLALIGMIGLGLLSLNGGRMGRLLVWCAATGVVAYAAVGGAAPRYLHAVYVVTLIAAAGWLAALATERLRTRRNWLLLGLVLALCVQEFCFVVHKDGIAFQPVVERDDVEMVAAQWMAQNLPPNARPYCAANIGLLTGRDYVPILVLRNQPAVREYFGVDYLVVDRYFAQAAMRGDCDNPFRHFDLALRHRVGDPRDPRRVEIYEIVGPAPPFPGAGGDWLLWRDPSYNIY